MRKYVIMGVQGSGKGTQSRMLAADLDLVHISVGDIFRWNVQQHTKLGAQVRRTMAGGELVADETVEDIVRDRLTQHDWNYGFIVDGFPRNRRQAEFFLESYDIDGVIHLELPDSEVRRRVLARRLCSGCGMDYNLIDNSPDVPGKCDNCGGELVPAGGRYRGSAGGAAARVPREDRSRCWTVFRRKEEFVITVDARPEPELGPAGDPHEAGAAAVPRPARRRAAVTGERPMRDITVFSGTAHPGLAREICAALGTPLHPVRLRRFANDCLDVQLQANCRERDVFLIQPLVPPVQEHLVELLLMTDAARGASAARVTVVMPHYAYARSDKKDEPRISIGGRLVADLLVAAGASRVLTMTLHSPQVHGFFSVPVDHLHALRELAAHFRASDLSDTVVVSPDLGHAKERGDVRPAARACRSRPPPRSGTATRASRSPRSSAT